MCGLHWYRQELEKADGNDKKLDELKQMIEQRFGLSADISVEKATIENSEIISLYKEIISRKTT